MVDDTYIIKKDVLILEKVSDKNEAVIDVNAINVMKDVDAKDFEFVVDKESKEVKKKIVGINKNEKKNEKKKVDDTIVGKKKDSNVSYDEVNGADEEEKNIEKNIQDYVNIEQENVSDVVKWINMKSSVVKDLDVLHILKIETEKKSY